MPSVGALVCLGAVAVLAAAVGVPFRSPTGAGRVSQPQTQQGHKGEPAAPGAAIDLSETHIVLRREGVKVADIDVPDIRVQPDRRYVVFSPRVEGTLYDRDGGALRLHADEVVLDRQAEIMAIRGHIRVTSAQHDRLEAAVGRWDSAKWQLVFPGDVHGVVGGTTIEAAEMTVDVGLRVLDLANGVVIHFRGPSPAP